ncbi:NAD(P)H-dependent oxidoreductase [Psychroflexus sp. S27]|uniref:nitroreductase family protein n=1 Tax=Psychroflexus sp. S27 TaxID=1982757 RepID=UPI000C2985D5|nr:nitroreductase family protein [Psychroflexus sp. S27]PJX20681.1 NAD(P)H-dependent oxidoreductase [Psychroflexus sp. S27]
MNTLKALNWRYAAKKFQADKIVSDEKLDIITKAFNLTPTSYGLQPLRLAVVSDPDLKYRLYEKSMHQEQVRTASHILVICIEDIVDSAFIENNFELQKEIRNTPDEVLAPFRNFLLEFFKEKDKSEKDKWAINQAYLALGNLLTVCAKEEIDACPMEGFQPDAYGEILKLKEKSLKPVLVLPIGYRDEEDQFASFEKVRRPIEETIIYYK